MDGERLGDDPGHGHARIERGERILEDDLHVAPPPPERGGIERQDVFAIERDASRGRLDEPEEEARQGRLAASRFPHNAQRLALLERQADAVDGARNAAAAARLVVLDQILGDEERAGHGTGFQQAAR